MMPKIALLLCMWSLSLACLAQQNPSDNPLQPDPRALSAQNIPNAPASKQCPISAGGHKCSGSSWHKGCRSHRFEE